MLMDQMDLEPELVRGHLLNMCKGSDHWAFHHQYEYRLDAHIHLQDNDETRPHTLLALEELQEQHPEEALVQEVQEDHHCIHKDKQCWLQSRPHWCTQAWEVLGQGLALDRKEMEQGLAGTAGRVWQALLSALQAKYQLREGSLVPRRCGKQLQGQAPAR